MRNSSLSEDYLHWLGLQTREEISEETHWDLIRIMFEKDFTWVVPNDNNRIVDGLNLRVEFCYAQHIRPDALKNLGSCSFLEVLIELSRLLTFVAGGSSPGWAWQLLANLGLQRMLDPLRRGHVNRVHDILDAVIRRTYKPNGNGGFFPLAWTDEDQTKIELWYQMNEYVNEIHPEHR